MKSYEDLRQEAYNENWSLKKIRFYLLGVYVLKFLYSETVITLISAIPFFLFYWLGFGISMKTFGIAFLYFVVHFIFYVVYLRKDYRKTMLDDYLEISLMAIVVRDWIKERKVYEKSLKKS
ncbi:MAG: hypothetical protein RL432_1381 [Bacteroidota bacterium]|jgi:hypothetical protein